MSALTRRAPLIGLFLLLIVHAAFNLYWLANDTRPRMGDEAQHASFAQSYYRALAADAPPHRRAIRFVLTRTGIYPPLFHAASAGVAYPLGGTRLAFGVLNTAVFLALIAVMYRFARLYAGSGFALLTATLTSFTPFLFGLSRLFLADLMSCLAVALAMWLLVLSDGFRRTRVVLLFALVNALGFWIRWITGLYYLVPLAYCLLQGFMRALRRPQSGGLPVLTANVAATLLIALAVAGPWYLPRIPAFQHTWDTHFKTLGATEHPFPIVGPAVPRADNPPAVPRSAGAVPFAAHAALSMLLAAPPEPLAGAGPPAGVYPFERPYVELRLDSPAIWLTYLLIIINKGLFLPATILALVGMALSLRYIRARPVVVYTLLWVLGSYLLLTLGWYFKSPAPRYAAQMLPALAFFAAVAIYAIPWRAARNAVIGLVLLVQIFQFLNLTLGGFGRFGNVELALATDHHVVTHSFDQGVAVLKDAIDGGGARMGHVFRGENWVQRSLSAIVEHDIRQNYTAWPEARIMLVGLRKDAIEAEQRHYWPQVTPLSDARHNTSSIFIGPYVSAKQALLEHGDILVAPAPVSAQLAAPPDSDAADAHFAAWLITLPRPVRLDAVSLATPPNQTIMKLMYWSPDEVYEPILPDSFGDGPKTFHFQAFPTIETDQLVALLWGTTDPAQPEAAQLDLYVHHRQPRPVVLTQNPEWLTKPRALDMLDYVIVPHEPTPLEAKLLNDFYIIDQFTANAWTYWDRRDFVVLARSQPPLIALDNNPSMRIRVSGDTFPDGRWDLPWWRFPQYSAPGYATASRRHPDEDILDKVQRALRAIEGGAAKLYWAAATPAVAEVNLGGPHVIQGFEIVPYSETHGVGYARAELWDELDAAWVPLPESAIVGAPKHQAGRPSWAWRKHLPLWSVPVTTTRIRIILEEGAPEIPSKAYVAHFYLFGRPIDAGNP
jgi:4-amino-4-deoxy-L-arabinose transferase-like glycosyltransferase